MSKSYRVLEYAMDDMGEAIDPKRGTVVEGFPTEELAREYAQRRIRASIEAMRRPGQSAESLRYSYFLYGINAVVLDSDYRGSQDIERFLATPASQEDKDYHAILTKTGLR